MMIKINLLPIESFRQTASGQLSVTIFAFIMVALCIGLYFFKTLVMDAKIEAAETERNNQAATVAALKKASEEALKQTTAFANQLVQVSAISELEERRRDQTRLLATISGLVNSQASWITNFNHEKGLMTIKGIATDMQVVAEFQESMQKDPLLRNVTLVRTTQDLSFPQLRLFVFDMRAETLFPNPTLMEAGLPDVNLPPREKMIRDISTAAPTLGESIKKSAEAPSTL
ncbi:MAG: PilN domain-containing protein [Deltaproteobacteria bacterium]|jgi:Tfp pilus assembly protein PilN|nr:PilN domain-containing protein [Deltaproteobacteria bacterium]